MPPVPSIAAVAYAVPAESRTLAELGAAGLLQSEPALLERFGFAHVHVATAESPFGLGQRAAESLMATEKIDPLTVDALIWGGPQGPTAFVPMPGAVESSAAHRSTARFHFPGTRLQHALGLDRATVLGIDQTACTTLLGAVRVARALCIAEGLERVLCVASEFFPADAGREAIFNCTSDAAVAVLVDRDGERNRIRGARHVTKGYYWNADALRDELVASYFPTARHVIQQAAAAARWSLADIDWVIPHNVGRQSWAVLLGLLGIDEARLWDANIPRIGHTLAGDNFINLADAVAAGAVRPGHRLILFSYGYGAHWTALAVEA